MIFYKLEARNSKLEINLNAQNSNDQNPLNISSFLFSSLISDFEIRISSFI